MWNQEPDYPPPIALNIPNMSNRCDPIHKVNAFWISRYHSVLYAVQREMGHTLNIQYNLLSHARRWLSLLITNHCEVYTRISRLTSLAWNIMSKERYWWRHNCDHDRRPLPLPLRCDAVFTRATLCLHDDLGQIKGVLWGFKAAETSQNLTNIVWASDKFVTPCVLPRIREFIQT